MKRQIDSVKWQYISDQLSLSVSGDITKPVDFENYMMPNGVGGYTCSLCAYTKSRTLVRLHVESIHFPNTFSYICPVCEKAFGTNKAFIMHKNRAHKWFTKVYDSELSIKICSWVPLFLHGSCSSGGITKPEDFEKYLMSNGAGGYTCSLCSYTKTRTLVRNHVESIHFPNTFTYKCDLCGKTFGTNNAFLMHKKRFHSKSDFAILSVCIHIHIVCFLYD